MRELLDLFDAVAEDHDPDFVLFPELATTPYWIANQDPKYREWAEPIPGVTSGLFADRARTHGCHILLPIYERAGDAYHNSLVVLGPGGEIVPGEDASGEEHAVYRKTHLPRWGEYDEGFHFRAGAGIFVYRSGGVAFGCLICYDRRFPECWRTLRALGADVVFVPVAGDGGDGPDFFVGELRTHARENGLAAAAANKCGAETVDGSVVKSFGHSCVVGADGEVLARAGGGGPEAVVYDLDLEEIGRVREEFSYYEDRRPELYANDGGR